MKYHTVQINGGAGKSVMFSGVIKNLQKSFPEHKHIVITGYPEVLINDPNFYRVYKLGSTPYFYEDFVRGSDNIISSAEPYNESHYLKGEQHLISTWSSMLQAGDEFQHPEMFISVREFEVFKNQFIAKFGEIKKPLLVINPFGGINKDVKYNWNRDIPPMQAQLLVDALKQDYAIVQICMNEQIKLKNCLNFSASLRELCCLLMMASKRILIDSFCQHAAAALQLPSTVLWITNTPKVFGYDIHTNIIAKEPDNIIHKIDSTLQEHNFTGSWNHYYPYNDSNVFNISEIVDTL